MIGDRVRDGGVEFEVVFDGRQYLLGAYSIRSSILGPFQAEPRESARRARRRYAERKRHERTPPVQVRQGNVARRWK